MCVSKSRSTEGRGGNGEKAEEGSVVRTYVASQILSYESYLMSPMTNWAAHAGRVHPAIPGDPVRVQAEGGGGADMLQEPRLLIPKAQGLWSMGSNKKAKGKDGTDLE